MSQAKPTPTRSSTPTLPPELMFKILTTFFSLADDERYGDDPFGRAYINDPIAVEQAGLKRREKSIVPLLCSSRAIHDFLIPLLWKNIAFNTYRSAISFFRHAHPAHLIHLQHLHAHAPYWAMVDWPRGISLEDVGLLVARVEALAEERGVDSRSLYPTGAKFTYGGEGEDHLDFATGTSLLFAEIGLVERLPAHYETHMRAASDRRAKAKLPRMRLVQRCWPLGRPRWTESCATVGSRSWSTTMYTALYRCAYSDADRDGPPPFIWGNPPHFRAPRVIDLSDGLKDTFIALQGEMDTRVVIETEESRSWGGHRVLPRDHIFCGDGFITPHPRLTLLAFCDGHCQAEKTELSKALMQLLDFDEHTTKEAYFEKVDKWVERYGTMGMDTAPGDR